MLDNEARNSGERFDGRVAVVNLLVTGIAGVAQC
jgi:hypothetical protein